MKRCPKCDAVMTMGAAHTSALNAQWECVNCGYTELTSYTSWR